LMKLMRSEVRPGDRLGDTLQLNNYSSPLPNGDVTAFG
jgi:hypothetical protein